MSIHVKRNLLQAHLERITAISVAKFTSNIACIYNACKVINEIVEYVTKWKQPIAINSSTNQMTTNYSNQLL